MNSKNERAIGIFIIAAGLVILLGKLGVFAFLGRAFWPLVILVPGLILQVMFFRRLAPAWVLIPGGMLSSYGVLFFICNTWGWSLMHVLWPAWILGIAAGLWEYAMFEIPRPRLLYSAAVILAVVSIVLFLFSLLHTGFIYIAAVLLIAAGAWLLFGRGRGRKGW
ncbi:hypothetical protein Q5741_03265 [Paenibacillus sp. JX-17]|uniref:DUF5668 domain-containing protein n=1 Tax=Paenibacillus lacisoli TaxID=3064525 RepID=A0ABT9C869_9BACL|nr:hypothetical protein [Paenibacillus sp. JX-17]MDO7905430.1 hypothetical protein [Paenibacillus sp. JX-17]